MVTSQLRGDKVVAVILHAALDELGERGYLAFSIEAVAERAGVNKTTIYRRWPTRDDLVRAALSSEGTNVFAVEDRATLEETLLVVARRLVALLRTRRGRALYTMLLHADSEHDADALFPPENRRAAGAFFARAAARGELGPAPNVELASDAFYGTIMQVALLSRKAPSEARLRRLVALVIAGARAVGTGAPATKKAR